MDWNVGVLSGRVYVVFKIVVVVEFEIEEEIEVKECIEENKLKVEIVERIGV